MKSVQFCEMSWQSDSPPPSPSHPRWGGRSIEVLITPFSQPRGILQSITARCSEINHKANRPLSLTAVSQSLLKIMRPAVWRTDGRRVSHCQLCFCQCYSLFNILFKLFSLPVFFWAVCIVWCFFLNWFYFVYPHLFVSVYQRISFHGLCCTLKSSVALNCDPGHTT